MKIEIYRCFCFLIAVLLFCYGTWPLMIKVVESNQQFNCNYCEFYLKNSLSLKTLYTIPGIAHIKVTFPIFRSFKYSTIKDRVTHFGIIFRPSATSCIWRSADGIIASTTSALYQLLRLPLIIIHSLDWVTIAASYIFVNRFRHWKFFFWFDFY